MSGDRRRRSTARALSLTISEMLPLISLSRARAHTHTLGFLPLLVDSWSTLQKEAIPRFVINEFCDHVYIVPTAKSKS